MKSVLISIQPKWCELIASGQKTIEVRKSRPQLQTPFKCYIYETNKKEPNHLVWIYGEWRIAYGKRGKGKVICEFVCDRIDEYNYDFDGVNIDEDTLLKTMLDREEINIYAKGKTLYGLHISDLKIYDTPKELGEFTYPCKKGKTDFNADTNCKGCNYAFKAVTSERIYCDRVVFRPPQSWGYVEELYGVGGADD